MEYGTEDGFIYRELPSDAFFDGLYITPLETTTIPFSPIYDNVLWAEPSDFTYKIISEEGEDVTNTNEYLYINPHTGEITHLMPFDGYKFTIECTHKPTGMEFTNVTVTVTNLLPKKGDIDQWNSISHRVGYWSDNEVTIYIDPLDAEGVHATYFEEAFEYAIDEWNQTLSGYLVLKKTTDKANADICCYGGSDIRIKAEDACNYSGNIEHSLGGAIVKASQQKCFFSYGTSEKIFIEHQKYVIYIRADANALDTTTGNHYKVVAVHELGHALGYLGHTDEPTTTMYPKSGTNSSFELNNDEINFMRYIYSLREVIEQ